MTKLVTTLLASAITIDIACQASQTTDTIDSVTMSRLADAIFRAEGTHSKHPYGVMIPCTSPRRVCINTVTHAWKDFERERWQISAGSGYPVSTTGSNNGFKAPITLPFIQFLGSRYCPPSADLQGFKNWTNNTWRILNERNKVTK